MRCRDALIAADKARIALPFNRAVALESPSIISQAVLAKGLDSGTTLDILCIDIADVNIGKNIGVISQTDQAEADKRVAQAKVKEQRVMAIAAEQESLARSEGTWGSRAK